MGVRESIQSSKLIVIAAAVIAVGAAVYTIKNNSGGPKTVSTEVFATVDDGKTVFVTDLTAIPPFEHEGKTAYRVWMFTTDGGKTRFPGYLERFTPEAKKRAEEFLANRQANPNGPKSPPVGPADMEVKKPGAGNPWVKSMSPEGTQVTSVTAPNGGEVDIVLP